MYESDDTIVAVSSPTSEQKVIVRISGPATIETCKQIFNPSISHLTETKSNFITKSNLVIDDELEVDAQLYLFFSPHSYTGEDVAEIHLYTNPDVTAALVDKLLNAGLRSAGPGEFTARAYLNSKIDLAQAEAVNEIIVSSNRFQLQAAEHQLRVRNGFTVRRNRRSSECGKEQPAQQAVRCRKKHRLSPTQNHKRCLDRRANTGTLSMCALRLCRTHN
jgi:tRNA modification GTPase